MISYLFILTAIVYSAYAYLPFMDLGAKAHYLGGIIFAILGSLIWVTISRTVEKSQIVLNGAIFDSIITICFLAIPFIFASSEMTTKQIVGIVIVLIGMGLIKF